ncbi:patatin-like phospholipase family protein [Roseateles sp. BYS87W]|uniref:Patatin-like phospholipase family protein n=1 Tax=Pelomonas baiyunensis TaxID=3299026 RepID=A0ABW7GYJ1_9BURK
MYALPMTGLVLSGGGARAAYQVGVLRAIARIRRELLQEAPDTGNPFAVISGTSAGAINGAGLACYADDFDAGVERLAEAWANFHASQVYRCDTLGLLTNGLRWMGVMSMGWTMRRLRPKSLLDNSPLAELMRRLVPMHRLPTMLARRHLHALAISASSYTTGQHVTFYQSSTPIPPWVRTQRIAAQTMLVHEHLMASSAIPFIFPATRLHHEGRGAWYGDGSMRQSSPLSPAIHLGAKRLVIIGAGRMHQPQDEIVHDHRYPSLAQVAGHAMSSIFLDALSADIERMQRVNRTLEGLSADQRANHPLQPIESIVIAPSQRLDDVAARHIHRLPKSVQLLLRSTGVRAGQRQGAALASYLLFESAYTQELLELGEKDGMAQREALHAFLQPSEFTLMRTQRLRAVAPR